MPILRQPIKISKAAAMLDISVTAIKERKAGTKSLTLFKRKGCADTFTWLPEVERLLDESNLTIIAKGEK